MFRTHDDFEIPSDGVTGRPGDRFWVYIQVMFRNSWFFATFVEYTTGKAVEHCTILADLTQVTGLVHDKGVIVKQVMIVTPPVINGTDRWLFEELTEAWECECKLSPKCPALVYVVASGKEYPDSFLLVKQPKMKRLRKVFPTTSVSNRAIAH